MDSFLGFRIEDPDICEVRTIITLSSEKNEGLINMYTRVNDRIECVERIRIFDSETACITKAVVVARPGSNQKKVKMRVENVLNRIKPLGVQVYVYLVEKIYVNLSLVVEVLDGGDSEQTKRHSREGDRCHHHLHELTATGWACISKPDSR